MKAIDGDKLRAYLDQINSFATNRSHAIRADGGNFDRFDGIRELATKIVQEMDNGVFEIDTEKTPIEKINVQVQNVVRKNDGQTSWDAALSAVSGEKRRVLYSAIIAALTKWGQMHDEVLAFRLAQNHIQFSDSGLRTRRSELVKAGWVRDSGERASTSANGKSVVWELVP